METTRNFRQIFTMENRSSKYYTEIFLLLKTKIERIIELLLEIKPQCIKH